MRGRIRCPWPSRGPRPTCGSTAPTSIPSPCLGTLPSRQTSAPGTSAHGPASEAAVMAVVVGPPRAWAQERRMQGRGRGGEVLRALRGGAGWEAAGAERRHAACPRRSALRAAVVVDGGSSAGTPSRRPCASAGASVCRASSRQVLVRFHRSAFPTESMVCLKSTLCHCHCRSLSLCVCCLLVCFIGQHQPVGRVAGSVRGPASGRLQAPGAHHERRGRCGARLRGLLLQEPGARP